MLQGPSRGRQQAVCKQAGLVPAKLQAHPAPRAAGRPAPAQSAAAPPAAPLGPGRWPARCRCRRAGRPSSWTMRTPAPGWTRCPAGASCPASTTGRLSCRPRASTGAQQGAHGQGDPGWATAGSACHQQAAARAVGCCMLAAQGAHGCTCVAGMARQDGSRRAGGAPACCTGLG